MLGGRGWNNDAYGPMMGGRSGRGNTGYGYGPMMGGNGYGPGYTQGLQPLTIDEARQAAESYLKDLGLEGLKTYEWSEDSSSEVVPPRGNAEGSA